MVDGMNTGYRWWCITCDTWHPRDVSHSTAAHGASDHAAKNNGHTVFVMRHGRTRLELFYFPPNAMPLLAES